MACWLKRPAVLHTQALPPLLLLLFPLLPQVLPLGASKGEGVSWLLQHLGMSPSGMLAKEACCNQHSSAATAAAAAAGALSITATGPTPRCKQGGGCVLAAAALGHAT
jgi:hypothetical protein